MKTLKIIGIIILILIVIIIILGLVAPKKYHVERTTVIKAPKDLVFMNVKYWQKWIAWNPWGKQDSTMKITVEGTDGEVGSKYIWVGDPKLTGKGEMVNTGVKENEEMTFHLHFLEPWESESDGYIRVADTDSGTKVSWAFLGKNPFPWNIMMLFMSMDKTIGPDFEKGLALLKSVCEKQAAAVQKFAVKEVDFPGKTYAIIRKTISFNNIQKFYAESFGKIIAAMQKHGAVMTGAPSGIYFSYDEGKGVTDMAAAIPVSRVFEEPGIDTYEIPAGKAYKINYYGPYEKIGDAHIAMDFYFHQNSLKQQIPVVEEYVTDPGSEADSSKWLTVIYYFAK
ncbi:MAG: hypothetical protein GXO74_07425 [Calditrichaeota bacterium]|nr:hypothetical protein [Calditrichota bacterium]